jgi:DnaD/phage-associated family protein
MRVERVENPLFADLRLPVVFVDSIMPRLSGAAVKLFLSLLVILKRGETVELQQIGARSGLTESETSVALAELQREQVLRVNPSGNLALTDLKEAALQKEYRRRSSPDLATALDRTELNQRRAQLINNISETFFQGVMGAGWYAEIDKWFEEYHFDPEVMYALFSECYNRNKLTNRAYIRAVAADWASRGIRTYADLSRDQEKRTVVGSTIIRVGKALNRSMTSYDEEIVKKWVVDYQYDFEVINEALSKLSGIQNPNLNYADKVITGWHEAGLTTLEQIREAELRRRTEQRQAVERQIRTNGFARRQRADNVGNFPQRTYSKEFLDSFYVDVMTGNSPSDTDPAPEGGVE